MRDVVRDYYGKVLQGSCDLRTGACSAPNGASARVRAAEARIHEEITATYYGCGAVYPPVLDGLRVLDLGCGSGRDCYVLAQLVGPRGRVVGVDMTDEQLAIARRHLAWHMDRFGYAEPNVEFHKGYLETLDDLALAPVSFDLIVSNCVINLATDKPAVLRQAWRLLKPGGEFYFADVYADRRVPPAVAADPTLYGECLGGALYWHDFLTMARAAGFRDPRLVEDRPIAVGDPALAARVQPLRFFAATYRLFKLHTLEAACEDYGQAVRYRGTLDEQPGAFRLDRQHCFEHGRIERVCGNTWRMLEQTRFAPHFDFHGTWDTHFGILEGCGIALPFATDTPTSSASACC